MSAWRDVSAWRKVSFAEMVTRVATNRAPDTAPETVDYRRVEGADDPMFIVEVVRFPHMGGGEIYAAFGYEYDPAYTPGVEAVFYVREDPF